MELRTLLIPVDFGEASGRALDLGVAIAAKFEAKLLIVHAFHVPAMAYADDSLAWVAQWSTETKKELDLWANKTRRRHADTESLWIEGEPRRTILELANARGVDLIVSGTHGRSGLSHLFFGSVAERLVRTSPVPLITTSAPLTQDIELPTPLRHVLIATDFGEPAQRSRAIACDIARRFDANLTIMHAFPVGSGSLVESAGWPWAEALSTAQQALEAERALAKESVPQVDAVFVRGNPREQILKVARDHGVDLVALGTHARRGLSRVFLGSVAEAIVRASEIAVLTAAADDHAQNEGDTVRASTR